MYTVITKQRLKELDACEYGFKKFVKVNGESATLSQALDSNGWDDIWWYISEDYSAFSEQQKKELHLLGCDWAESCLSNFEKEFPDDKRPRLAIEAKRKWLNGEISNEDLASAESAAWSAAWSARSAAWSAWSAESAAMEKITQELKELFLKWEEAA